MHSTFQPMLWPEDALPEESAEYARCEICTPKSRIIWGEGNPKASVMVLLDNPGAREDSHGNPYVCGTRQTLQSALHHAGFSPEDLYVTYLLKCRPLYKYHKEAVRAFSKPFLLRQMHAMQPKFMMCLGDVVVQSMLNREEAHVKDLRGVWQRVYGFPCLVSYHPLAVRRRPNLMPYFLSDLKLLMHAVRNVQSRP